ncbi:MAG: hypothetical protein NWF14_06725 [Candidatus Bathyarchaeota archaeon]|nr:hypothetical protein [Candidatus Bathyarchaeota archaeon]
MGKTDTIKKRAIYVYLPSQEMASRWKELAEKQGTSISKFVSEHVENSLRQDESSYLSRSFLIEENRKLREGLEEKEKRNRHLELLVDKLEEDLRRYRAQLFLDEGFTGVRRYDRKLIEILREPGVHGNEEILSRLGVKPTEHETIKAVSKQLENLQSYGLVKSTPRGWAWQE